MTIAVKMVEVTDRKLFISRILVRMWSIPLSKKNTIPKSMRKNESARLESSGQSTKTLLEQKDLRVGRQQKQANNRTLVCQMMTNNFRKKLNASPSPSSLRFQKKSKRKQSESSSGEEERVDIMRSKSKVKEADEANKREGGGAVRPPEVASGSTTEHGTSQIHHVVKSCSRKRWVTLIGKQH